MKLSKAYNKKNLIDENWVIDRLKQEWKVMHNSYYWSADTELYGKTIWVSLSFGYRDDYQPGAMYYSSFGINSKNANESYIIANHCWGQVEPNMSDVIWYYCDKIQVKLFPRGPRNKTEFII